MTTDDKKSSKFTYVNKPLPLTVSPPVLEEPIKRTVPEVQDMLNSNTLKSGKVAHSKSVVDKLIELFTWDDILFGPREFFDSEVDFWREQFGYFVKNSTPLQFVAMAFPYKVPNPAKTGNRFAPDAGEALMLIRFKEILQAVEEVYENGAHLTILEEGILGRCQGVDPREVQKYRDGIPFVMRAAGVDEAHVSFFSLDRLQTFVPNFEARWYFEQERLRSQWEGGDSEIVEAYRDVFPNQRAGVPVRDLEPARVLRALSDVDDSSVRYIREYLDAVAHREFFAYRALLNIRDVSNIIGEVSPHALKLTVSPKPRNLAATPINSWTSVLPYHGVAIRDMSGTWTIDYYANLGTFGPLSPIHVDGDPDPAPFAFQRLTDADCD